MNPNKTNKTLQQIQADRQIASLARERLEALFDADTFVELYPFVGETGTAGVITGTGYIGDLPVYAFSQDVAVDHGAMTVVHAKKILKLYDLAEKTGCPVVALFDSNGAKVSQANAMLVAYGEILAKVNRLSGMVPQFAAVLGPCTGTSALLACSADVLVMSEAGELFLNPPMVTSKKDVAVSVGTADFVATAGLASLIAKDEKEAIDTLRRVLSMFPQNNLSPAPLAENAVESMTLPTLQDMGQTIDTIEATALFEAVADQDSVTPLLSAFGKGIAVAIATIAGATVGMIAHDQKQGVLNADACDKATRFVRLCDAFHIPIVTFINTNGFEMTAHPLLIRQSARVAHAYTEATTPKITILIGQAIGAAYLAFAAPTHADLTIGWPTAVISAMGLEASVEFLHHDKLKGTKNLEQSRQQLVEDYISTTAGSFCLAEHGYIDGVIAPERTRSSIITAIEMLAGKRQSNLPKKHAIMPL